MSGVEDYDNDGNRQDEFIVNKKNPYQPQINAIRRAIHAEDKALRQKYSWLKYQNEIGVAWFLGSLLEMGIVGYAYIVGALAWYWTIPLMALGISILHELEHDIIHELYYKDKKWIHHVMFAFIWVAKVSSNPWWRKAMHLKHHKVSGQVTDIEERLIGLGLPWGLKRILITLTPLATLLVVFDVAHDSFVNKSKPYLYVWWGYALNAPVFLPAHLMFVALFFPQLFSDELNYYLWLGNVLVFLPNVLRQACLQFVSTACHYFGDIPEENVFFQNQILNHWSFLPFQLFCFNFGETHIIHHYVTRQPFYLRQMIAPGVLAEMRKQGVRYNDLKIIKRANRYADDESKSPRALLAAQASAAS